MDSRELIISNQIMLEEVAALLEEGKEVTLAPRGSSMLPFIREGRDLVNLQLPDSVDVGNIVLAHLPQRYVLHRIIDINQNRLTLMGDGNLTITERCTKADVLGVVVGIVRDGKRTVRPGKARVWRALYPLRRILLAVYRRLPYKLQ